MKPVMVVSAAVALIVLLAVGLAVSGSYRLESRALAQSDPARTLRDLRLAQIIRPLSSRLHAEVARSLLQQGRLDDALHELSRSLRSTTKINFQLAAYAAYANGNRADATRLLAESEHRGGDPLDGRLEAFLALPDLSAATRLDASDQAITTAATRGVTTEPSRLLFSSRLLLSYHLLAPAHEFAARLTTTYPQIPVGWRQLALVELTENAPDTAVTSLETARDLSPTDKETYRLLAQAYSAAGRAQDSAAAQTKAESLR